MSITLQRGREADALAGLQAAWEEFTADSPDQAPFYTWDWFDCWWRHFREDNSLFLVRGADHQGRLQWIAPLMLGPRSLRGWKLREIRFSSNSISPRCGLLVRQGVDRQAAWRALVECLAEHRAQWDQCRLWNVPVEHLVADDLRVAAAGCRLQTLPLPGWRSPYIAVSGDFAAYLGDQLGKNRRRGILQKVRQLTAQPGFGVLDFQAPEEVERGLELAFAVSRASWKGPLGTHMSGCPLRTAFYREVTRRLASRGQVRIWIAMLDEVPLAVQYSLVSSDASYLVINDFHAQYARFSPGTVLLYEVLQRTFDEGRVAQFQFSGDVYDYKSQWATGMREHADVELFHAGTYSRLLCWTKARALPAWRRLRARFWPHAAGPATGAT